MFYGQGCAHCEKMMPLVDQLESELNIPIERLETWRNQENQEYFRKCDIGGCGGVPYFFNTKSEKFICGEASYHDLLAWAKEER